MSVIPQQEKTEIKWELQSTCSFYQDLHWSHDLGTGIKGETQSAQMLRHAPVKDYEEEV